MLGYILAFLNVNIWALGHVFARLGITENLLPEDILLLRFTVATLCVLPMLFLFPKVRGTLARLKFSTIIMVSMSMGLVYILLSLLGVYYFPAARATIIITGCLPFFSVLYEKFIEKRHFSWEIYLGLVLILVSIIAVFVELAVKNKSTGNGEVFFSRNNILGILVCLGASASYAYGLFMTRRLKLTPIELLASVSIPTLIGGAGVWVIIHLIKYKGAIVLDGYASMEILKSAIFQGIYQGLFVSVVAVLLVGVIVKKIGNVAFSYFIAGIPLLSLLYSPLIGESITSTRFIAGILSLIGIVIANRSKNKI